MITAGFGLESFVSGRPRAAVRRDPMAESRIRANEMTSSIAGNLVIVVPFAIEHESHIGSPFRYRHSCIKSYRHKKVASNLLQRNSISDYQFALTPLSCFCDKLVNSTRMRDGNEESAWRQ